MFTEWDLASRFSKGSVIVVQAIEPVAAFAPWGGAPCPAKSWLSLLGWLIWLSHWHIHGSLHWPSRHWWASLELLGGVGWGKK